MKLNPRTLLVGLVAGIALALFGVAVFGGRGEAPDAGAKLARGSVAVSFEGSGTSRPPIAQPFAVPEGGSAWDALVQALGESKLAYKDFGGDLGYQILGFDGVTLTGNRFWSFSVNGVSSDTGVSGYKVRDGDVLQFKIETY
jgi:hypothetical protein